MRTIVASLLLLLAFHGVGDASVMRHNLPAKPVNAHVNAHYDARPRAWCGWWMRHQMAVDPGPAYNLARNWAHYGTPAPGPAPGALVVFARKGIHGHVGKIVGACHRDGRGRTLCPVLSGNDRHAVRTSERDVSHALAFRWPLGSIAVSAERSRALPPTPPREQII